MELNFSERRVLGALMEKGVTTPDQYPLSLNALVNACNQKSCRHPISQLGENEILDTLDDLRIKHRLVAIIQTAGGRTDRWRHLVRDELELSSAQCAVLTELLLRGPRSDGELRQGAKRMTTLDSLQDLQEIVRSLQERDPPLVVRLSPDDRRRGVRYAHTLYSEQELEELRRAELESSAMVTASPVTGSSSASVPPPPNEELEALREEVASLRERQEGLEARLSRLEGELGA